MGPRAAGRFCAVNTLQGLLIGATAVLANVFHVQPYIPGTVAVVVGLHFPPLAGLFGRPEYRWTGVLVAAARPTSDPVGEANERASGEVWCPRQDSNLRPSA